MVAERAFGGSRPARPRIVSWLATFLYVTVLVAGLYGEIAGLCSPSLPRTAGFAAALAVLMAIEPPRSCAAVCRTAGS